jgi:hypothetical protein
MHLDFVAGDQHPIFVTSIPDAPVIIPQQGADPVAQRTDCGPPESHEIVEDA